MGLRQRPNSLRRRAAGAGTKRKLAWAVANISHWLSLERAYGHCISKAQFIQQYIRELKQRATELEVKADELGISSQQELLEINLRLSKLTTSKQREKWATKLAHWVGAKHLRPHQVSHLSELEELVRAQLTWQCFDSALWLCAFGSRTELAEHVGKPSEFNRHRAELVLGFSDQVPLWVKEE